MAHLDEAVTAAGGIALRYGGFYGPGDNGFAGMVRKRQYPIIGAGDGVTSWIHLDDAAAATVLALGHDGRRSITSSTTSPRRCASGCRCSRRCSAASGPGALAGRADCGRCHDREGDPVACQVGMPARRRDGVQPRQLVDCQVEVSNPPAARRIEDAVVTVGDYAVEEQAEETNQVRLTATGRLAPRGQRVRMLGSAAIDLAWLAQGRTDAAIIFDNKPWDTAAGVILVREAEGPVVDAHGDHHTVASATTVAASAELLNGLLHLIFPPT